MQSTTFVVHLCTILIVDALLHKKGMKPTEAELEILQVLWKKETATVREVYEQLAENKDIGYTTVLKQMQVMFEKGFVTRDESSKSHLYRAVISQNDTQIQLIDKLLHSVFDGSIRNMVLQVLGNQKSSKEELAEIKDFIEKIENDK